jgi:RNA polymerase sigma-70 factor (ECF subfamily)
MAELDALISKCKSGDEPSQRAVYERLKKKWLGISLRYVKDFDDAKDVFQEASLRIFTELPSLKEVKAFEGWACRIIVNTALNFLKQRQSYLFTLQQYAQENEFEWTSTDEALIRRMDGWELMNTINALPEGYRVVFNLYIIDGYKHAEIGEILGISESTSRSQLNKAKQYLKKVLEKKSITFNAKIIG